MNNNLYNWHDERMVEHEMQEVDRVVEQARLLQEAGLASGNWLGNVTTALRNWFARRSKVIEDDRVVTHPSFSSQSDEAAQ
jgi:hypothetical protein